MREADRCSCILYYIHCYQFQNDQSQEDPRQRARYHLLRRTGEGRSTSPNTQLNTKKLSTQLGQEMITLKNLSSEFQGIEKEGKHSTEESKTKLLIEVKMFEEKM